MVDTRAERLLGLLAKIIGTLATSEDSTKTKTIETTTQDTTVDPAAEPMMLYWKKDKEAYNDRNQEYIDLYQEGIALERIPDTVKETITESQYKFDKTFSYLPELAKTINTGVPETPKTGTGISSSGRDAGVVAGIVVAVISGIIILTGLIAVLMYRHYVHRNVTSINFDNPVYRKTTEDQFALEKNGYAPGSKLYPSTVGEEAQEPLNTPGTNDFV